MIPRRSSKKKPSTSIPVDYLKKIREVFSGAFKKHLKGRELYIEGRILQDEVLLRL